MELVSFFLAESAMTVESAARDVLNRRLVAVALKDFVMKNL